MAEFSTVAALVSDVAGELSLIADDVADPYASEDPNILQLCRMLKAVGREIIRKHIWSQALRTHTFNTTAATTYALPTDFLRMINQTGWNRTTRFPLGGPLSPQEWEYLTARAANVSFRLLFRPRSQVFEMYNGTSIAAGQTVAFEYLSSYWVRGPVPATIYMYDNIAGLELEVPVTTGLYVGDTIEDGDSEAAATITAIDGTTVTVDTITGFSGPGTFTVTAHTAGTKTAPTAATDTVLFDAHLMTRALKLAFLRDKGFDASNAKVEFDEALAAVMRDDTPAPVLSLNGPANLEPLIGEANVPITGYG